MDGTGVASAVVLRMWKAAMTLASTIDDRREAERAMRSLVGRRTGIVRELRFPALVDGDAPLVHASAAVADAHAGTAVKLRHQAAGSGQTRERAILAALGEAFERYAAACGKSLVLVRAREEELPGPYLSAAQFAAFSEIQRAAAGFPFVRPTPDLNIDWLAGRRLDHRTTCFVPAFAVLLPHVPTPSEPPIAPGLSTGLACAPTLEEAVLRGLCEVIERDALALTWLTMGSPPRINDAWMWREASDLLPPRDDVRAYDLTGDLGLPTILVVCRGRGVTGPLLSVGSACRPDRRSALRKAALEASQDRVYVRQLLKHEPAPALEDPADVRDFSQHARFYSLRPDLIEDAFAFLDQNQQISPISADTSQPDIPRDGILAEVAARGLDVVYVDLTPPDSLLPWHVVKVVAPSLLPLHGDHRLPFLGHERLRRPATALPHAVIRSADAPHPWPHPFP